MASNRGPATDSENAELTIEQLAHETGMSVRNIRNHQSRGLLPPPEVRARIGYYGPEHVARLRLIQEMQGAGFKLSAIERLIGEHGVDADRFVGLRQAVTAPLAGETSEVLTGEELAERFGTYEGRLLAKAQKLGLLVALDAGRYEATSPALLRAAEDVLGRGIPLSAALTAIEKLTGNSKSSARAFVRLFLEELWKPFDEAGRPEDRWPEIIEAIEQLPALASDALNATFRLALAEEIEKAFGEVLERRKKSGPGSSKARRRGARSTPADLKPRRTR
ncbi:MAG TPA: MerR family transcriptional regulator [Solirubrobacterales bacterium]|nr:MerR family transcriptional regulator [Solirubrobacterales bacterium]